MLLGKSIGHARVNVGVRRAGRQLRQNKANPAFPTLGVEMEPGLTQPARSA